MFLECFVGGSSIGQLVNHSGAALGAHGDEGVNGAGGYREMDVFGEETRDRV